MITRSGTSSSGSGVCAVLNLFVGIGRWSQEISLRYTPNGKAVANSTLAINERRGEEDVATFIPVVMWERLAETVAQHSDKGRLVCVVGRLQIRSYEDRDGNRRKAAEVVAHEVRFLDYRKREDSDDYDPFADDGEGSVPF